MSEEITCDFTGQGFCPNIWNKNQYQIGTEGIDYCEFICPLRNGEINFQH